MKLILSANSVTWAEGEASDIQGSICRHKLLPLQHNENKYLKYLENNIS